MKFTNGLRSLCILILLCTLLFSCKKKRYNYKCCTTVSYVNAWDDYSFLRTDTTYLNDATTKEANEYERTNTIRNVNHGEEATSTVCTIIMQ
ncbi:MAG: hypothetical protein K0Q79_3211 [Flavipsychrobacter sp.]|jgi:hypothetical protein|nr:hypothetical protein [Flavipsychrobacter sp.]